jgi:hypothetical protein
MELDEIAVIIGWLGGFGVLARIWYENSSKQKAIIEQREYDHEQELLKKIESKDEEIARLQIQIIEFQSNNKLLLSVTDMGFDLLAKLDSRNEITINQMKATIIEAIK